MDRFLNALIFVITLFSTARFFYRDGSWSLKNGASAFHYFTVQSNVFCAAAALLMCFVPSLRWVWTLKYIGTAAVTVTMLTVFLFLGPNMGYKKLLTGSELFMHLVTPLLAILSFFFLEKRHMPLSTALLGVLPVLLYGLLYLHKVVRVSAEKRWEDFYGFNKNGKWPISFAVMVLGAFAISLGFMFLQNR